MICVTSTHPITTWIIWGCLNNSHSLSLLSTFSFSNNSHAFPQVGHFNSAMLFSLESCSWCFETFPIMHYTLAVRFYADGCATHSPFLLKSAKMLLRLSEEKIVIPLGSQHV